MEQCWQRLGFDAGVAIGASGLSGGICLFWKNYIDISIECLSDHVISGTVKGSNNWKIMGVYGPPAAALRQNFWEKLAEVVIGWDLPWIIMGDFNLIKNAEEKSGGRRFVNRDGKILNEFLNSTGGLDLGILGNKFTWEYKKADGVIKERLDRIVASPSWLLLHKKAGVLTLPILASDHSPIILDPFLEKDRLVFPFRFFEAWSKDPACKIEVQRAWNIVVVGISSFILLSKLAETRRVLRLWSSQHHGATSKKLDSLHKQLQCIQNEEPSALALQEEASIQMEIMEIWENLESMWRQKSRELWLCEGDRNTKFFHASAVVRRHRNHVWNIRVHSATIRDRFQIGTYFNRRFLELFETTSPPIANLNGIIENRISDSERLVMESIPDSNEIRRVVWEMHPLKSPGPDGMSGCFYRSYWSIVGKEIVSYVQDFFRFGKFVKGINRTFIVLIPKRENCDSFDHYRPISLCNFAYKIISKLLANRMKKVLHKLISPFQAAFVPGRWIAEGTVLAQEVVHKIRRFRGKGGIMALKVDMSKAYDALLAKLAWKMATEKDNLCVKVLSSKYCSNDPFWECRSKASDSAIWKVILQTRDIIRKGSCYLIGDGDAINIWTFPWIPWEVNGEPEANFVELPQPKPHLVTVNELICQDTRSWNEEKLKQYFSAPCASKIANIKILPAPAQDRLIWKNSKSGSFSVKAAYEAVIASRTSENNSVWNKLWKSTLHERMKFLLWRILRNALPTRAVLAKRINIDSSCPLYGHAEETTLHLFKECPVTRAAWFQHAGLRIDCIPTHDLAEFFVYLVQEDSLQQDKSRLLLMGCICNFIWKARNEMAIKDIPVQVQRISLELRLATLEFSSSLTRKKHSEEAYRINASTVSLELESGGVQEVIAAVDASFKDGKAGLAVCLTVKGVDLFCAEVTEAANPLEAELMAIELALQVAKQRDINSISIKSDCQVAIKALSSGVPPPDWQSLAAFLKCVNHSSTFNSVTFVWISRSCNLVADAISRWILQSNRGGSFVSTELPISVASRIASI